jgi:hypothetical protein
MSAGMTEISQFTPAEPAERDGVSQALRCAPKDTQPTPAMATRSQESDLT